MAEPRSEMRALRILVIDDEETIRFTTSMSLEADGHKVLAVGDIEAALDTTAREAFDLIFLDVRLGTQNGLDYIKSLLEENPWARIIVMTAYASIETAVEAMKLGATDYLPKPFEPTQLTLLTQKVAERRLLERRVESLQRVLGEMDVEADFPTANPIWREAIEFARRAATANAPVLISGEPGTGRGRLARAIHEWSPRAAEPFVTVSFDGRSVDALETELFGSSADAGGKVGAIAFCHGGTLLLDEIGNLPMRLQPKLLSVIRDGEFELQDQFVRRPANVRIIATTSADLAGAVAAGKFRSDLLMSLNVVQVDIPALRDRPEDIMPLAERYLGVLSRQYHKIIAGFTRDVAFLLKSYLWPSNVRELRNVIERAVIACNSDYIGLPDLPADFVNAGRGVDQALCGYQVGDMVSLDVIEEAHIRQVLASAKTLRRAAAILGMNASALCRRLKRTQAQSGSTHHTPS